VWLFFATSDNAIDEEEEKESEKLPLVDYTILDKNYGT
jgi:hypothetical protein